MPGPGRTLDNGRAERLLGAVALAAVALAVSSRRLADFDLPWHLAFGRVVVQTRSFPRVDDLASTRFPIKYAEIVSDVALYLTHAAAGPLGLQVLGGLAAACIGLVSYLRAREAGALAIATTAAALVSVGSWLLVRPATLGFALAATCALLLETHHRHPDERRGRRALGLVVPLQLVWCNMHQSGSIGVALVVGYAGYRGLARALGGRAPALVPARDGRDAGPVAMVAAAAVLATTLNRGGWRYFPNPFDYAGLAPFATEWQTTTFPLLQAEPLAAGMLAVAVLALALGREADGARTPRLLDVGLVAFSLLMCVYFRLVPLAVILTAPIVARRLSFVTGALRPRLRLALAALALAAAPALVVREADPPGVGWLARHFPEGAVAFIEREAPQGAMWNFSPFGGYLEWRLHPRYRPLIDGRIFDVPWAVRVNKTEFDAGELRALAAERDLQWGVCRAVEGERFCVPMAEVDAWAMVYWDDVSAIYVKRDGPNRALAERGYRIFKHLDRLGDVLSGAVAAPDLAERIARDGELARAQAPSSPRAAFLAACGALARRDAAALDARLAELDRLAPGSPPLAALRDARRMARMGPGLDGPAPR